MKSTDVSFPVTLTYGFHFPNEQIKLESGTDSICKLLGPEIITCGTTEEGKIVTVEIVGALLGEAQRNIVSHTYTQMGLWLCKDYIRIERNNEILEDVFKGQYYYRSMLIFANCQQFDLTANRNDIRTDQEEYAIAVKGIKDFCRGIWNSEFVKKYFEAKKMMMMMNSIKRKIKNNRSVKIVPRKNVERDLIDIRRVHSFESMDLLVHRLRNLKMKLRLPYSCRL